MRQVPELRMSSEVGLLCLLVLEAWSLTFHKLNEQYKLLKRGCLLEVGTAASIPGFIYFSSSAAGSCDRSPRIVQGSTLPDPSGLEHLETKACVTSESAAILQSVPKPVLNAFHLLNESPEAQNVVASIVADKNVWDAVMKNEKVMEFYQSQQRSCDLPLNTDAATQEGFTGHGSTEQLPESLGDKFAWFVDNVKLKVVNMVSNLSEFFQNVIGSSAEETSSRDDNKQGNTDCTTMASFMALGILGIIVVLLRRGNK